MRFLLNTRYALRGWLKMPTVLFDLEKNRALRNLTLVEFWLRTKKAHTQIQAH